MIKVDFWYTIEVEKEGKWMPFLFCGKTVHFLRLECAIAYAEGMIEKRRWRIVESGSETVFACSEK